MTRRPLPRRLLFAAAVVLTATLSAVPTLTTAAPAQTAAAERLAAERQRAQRVEVNGTAYRPRGDVQAPPRVRARAWVVADLQSGAILGKHRARARLPQASTIKLLTAITAANRVDADRPVRATRLAASTICSCAGVKAGRRYTRHMLLGGMLVKSGNDAAEALAGGHPHGRSRFIAAMNKTADRLGASDTVAKNPSGLDQYGAHSSGRDLLLFLRAAAGRRPIATWLDTPSMRFGPISGRRHRLESSTDYLLWHADSYAAKNGYTSRAGNTLVAGTDYNGHRIGVAVLGAEAGYTTSGARDLTEWAGDNRDLLGRVGRLPGR